MSFNRKVNKDDIPTCNVLGLNIAAIDMEWLLNFTTKNVARLSGDYMCVTNVHTTILAIEDKAYGIVQDSGVMSIPDGAPLSIVGRKQGYQNMKRVTGPDYLEEVLKLSRVNGYSHYFLGSTEDTLEKLVTNINNKYPGIKIAGYYSPPFRDLSIEERKKIIATINAANPTFIWVGLGAPKQEFWMKDSQGKVKGFMIGVGAAFDYLAGNIQRAPKWMQKNSLEWLYRLIQDPRRLFKRYFFTNIKFLIYIFLKGNKKR